MAFRRLHGHAAAAAIKTALGLKVSEPVVAKWEKLMSSNLQLQQRHWYSEQEERLRKEHSELRERDPESDLFSWSITSVRGDATNTAVQHYKAHTCEIQAQYCFLTGSSESDDPNQMKTMIKGWADLAKVPVNNNARTQHGIYVKQLSSVGAPNWIERVSAANQYYSQNPDEHNFIWGAFHIAVFFFGSDQGSDQKAADKLISDSLDFEILVWKFRAWCAQHSLHLMVGRGRGSVRAAMCQRRRTISSLPCRCLQFPSPPSQPSGT